MEINENIYAKAIHINDNKKKIQDYVYTCINAGICPDCGGETITKTLFLATTYKCKLCRWKV